MSRPALAILAAAAVAALAVPAQANGQLARPNVLLIMSDDQTVESMKAMPKTRQLLGANGTTFANSFVGYSLCCPSRATMLSGQYNHNNGVLSNSPPDGGYEKLDHANTLPVWLQGAGYHTTHVGKYLNGYGSRVPQTTVPPGWSDWQGLVDPTTYRMYDYTINDNGTLRTYGSSPAEYQTDVLAARAEHTILTRAPQAQPFFLSVAPLAPHGEGKSPTYPDGGPPRPAPRHADAFKDAPLPRPPSFNEADVSDKPTFIRNRPRFTQQRIDQITTAYRMRLGSLLAIDDLVERLVTALSETGELDNTLILFTADNGFFHGEHRIPNGKVQVYEPSIRVPLLVRGPGFAAGATANAPALNVDLAATIAGAAGATPGRVLDGLPLSTVAAGATTAIARPVLNETGAEGTTRRYHTAIRTDRHIYVEHSNGEQELYDLATDPHQLTNVAGNPAFAPLQAELAARLAVLRKCSGAACIAPPPPSGTLPTPPVTGTPPGPSRPADTLAIRYKRLRLAGDHRVSILLECTRGSEDGCRGTLRLYARRPSKHLYRLGTRSFILAPGEREHVRVSLAAAARRLLRRERKLTAVVSATTATVSGLSERDKRTLSLRL